MFGYVNIYKPELKMKDYYRYKAYYCGLCKRLKDKYGHLGQMTLTYDMTFLIILLTSLYESITLKKQYFCKVHPIKKHDALLNEITDYVADMNIILAYFHLMDDWKDERSIPGLLGQKLFEKDYKKLCKKYPRQTKEIRDSLTRLKECEARKETNIDVVSRSFGDLMAGLFIYRKDIWEQNLRKVGFYLGKFIYLMDAYDDLEKDRKKANYNPLISIYENKSYEEQCKEMLTMMMAECTSEFEKLPLIIEVDILRNILYNGVWAKYIKLQNEKNPKEGIKE